MSAANADTARLMAAAILGVFLLRPGDGRRAESSPPRATQITAVTSDVNLAFAAVSPDGHTMLLVRPPERDVLWQMPVGGGEPAVFLEKYNGRAQYSPDGALLAYSRFLQVDDRMRTETVVVPAKIEKDRNVLQNVAAIVGILSSTATTIFLISRSTR